MSLDKGARVESDIERIKRSKDLSGRDKELLTNFKRDLKLDEASDGHVHKLLSQLRIMGERLDAEFEAEWVPREQNEGADALSKEAVDEYVQTHDYQVEGHPIVKCDECGAWMVARRGKYGMFYGCSRYPKCKNTKSIEKGGKETSGGG